MRPGLCAVLTVAALLCAVAPAHAGKDAFNSTGLRKAVTLQGVRAHQAALQNIADMNGGRRVSGTAGFDASADYVAGKLEDAGYDVTRQEFTFDYFEELAEPTFEQLAPTPTTYATPAQFATMTYSGSGNVTATAQHVVQTGALGPGCTAGDFAGFTDHNIALIQRGGCTFKIKATNAQTAGASAVVIYNNVAGPLNGTLGSVGQTIPVIGTLQSIGTALAAGTPPTLHITTSTMSEPRQTENVLADTPQGDPDRRVVVGAHLDSVVQGPGINDNGSGTAGILEIAEQFAARDIEPRNRVRFAWWGAEEFNLVGSTYYVNHLSDDELGQHMLNLNFDMIGSPNYVRFVYDGDNSAFPVGPSAAEGPDGSGLIEDVFTSYFANQGLASSPTAFSGRSDYGPFIAAGIPAGGLFTGAEGIKTAAEAEVYGGTAGAAYDPCYHQACDTFENNSDAGLSEMADAAAHGVYTFARTKAEITNDGALKPGRFGKPASGDGLVGTTAGGGADEAVAR
jgi:Zn-dependent M28 family amino/carboxypeptidase